MIGTFLQCINGHKSPCLYITYGGSENGKRYICEYDYNILNKMLGLSSQIYNSRWLIGWCIFDPDMSIWSNGE